MNYYSDALRSMLRDSRRMPGRPWLAELLCRAIRGVVDDPRNHSWPRLRKIVDATGGVHPAMMKVSFTDTEFAQIPCLTVSPRGCGDAVIVYLHGGGYVIGSSKGYRALLSQLAVNSRARVVAVDYRLAPEHPYPAPQDDCLNALQAVAQRYSQNKIIVAGDSAGGALAINSCLQASVKISGCVLISPWVDPLATDSSMQSNRDNDFLTEEFLNRAFDALMQGQKTDSQVRFTDRDLSALPPTLIQFGGGEIFVDQIEQFVHSAESAGVKLSGQKYPGQCHDFQLFSPLFKSARQAVNAIGDFINDL